MLKKNLADNNSFIFFFVFFNRSGSKPWYVFDENYNYIWDFSLYCGGELECIHKYFGKNEWNKMFDAWVYFCFRIDGFEIFLTETKGLGKRYLTILLQ